MQQRRQRNGMIAGLLSLTVLVGAAMLSSPTQAATSNGPYYAEPAWDQKLPAATRFIVLQDWNLEAVLDRETGLVWEKAPVGVGPWLQALGHCIIKNVGGRKGWRMPSIQELASLVDTTQGNQGLPQGHPFTVLQANYWSASTFAAFPTGAYHVHASNGLVDASFKTDSNQVWCVRGGMSVEPH